MENENATEGSEARLSDEAPESSPANDAQVNANDKTSEDTRQDSYYDQLVRLTADFENFKRRTQKERADFFRYRNEDLVAELLPVLDNFERAVEHATSAKDIGSIRQGIEMILAQLKQTLERHGVKSESNVGKEFNPLHHEAVSHIESADHPENTIVTEHQKAYFLHDRLLRPAMVAVSKGDRSDVNTDEDQEDTSDLNAAPGSSELN